MRNSLIILFGLLYVMLSLHTSNAQECSCEFKPTVNNRCLGVYCKKGGDCESGVCNNNFCTDGSDTSITCSNNPDAKCGKCGGVQCSNVPFEC